MRQPNSILITGASSGIGAALARCYAAPGVSLYLGGRDAARLEAVAQACRRAGARVRARVVDVTDATAMAAWVEAADAEAPLDLVVANAGINAAAAESSDRFDHIRQVFAVNVDGVINTVLPALAGMRRRGHGQIALMSSLHGLRGVPGMPAYSASKAAVRSWGDALRARLRGSGLEVSVICPGYVRSSMTPEEHRGIVSAEEAAATIRRGLAADRGRIVFPWWLYAVAMAKAAVPPTLLDRWRRRPRRVAAQNS